MQKHKTDQFFNAAQQERLTQLMKRCKQGSLSEEEEKELEDLVETEIDGARLRAEAMPDNLPNI